MLMLLKVVGSNRSFESIIMNRKGILPWPLFGGPVGEMSGKTFHQFCSTYVQFHQHHFFCAEKLNQFTNTL